MIRFLNPGFRFYQGLTASLMGVGLLLTILVVNNLAQQCNTGIDPAVACSCGTAVYSPSTAFMPRVERAVLDQTVSDGSARPWITLANHGMKHEFGEREYGEPVSSPFSRMVQGERFVHVFVFLIILAIILLGYRLFWYKPLLAVMLVRKMEIQGAVRCLGTIQSEEPVTVGSQRSGTIEKLHVAHGDKVAKGQILAELMPSTLKNEVKAAPEDIVKLVAATDGVITNCALAVGDEVHPGTPIFQILEADQIWVAARTSETRGKQVRAGQAAVIKLGAGREFAGEVLRIRKDPDPATRQYEVLVKFHDFPEPSVIGEEAAVIIATGRQTAPAVPLTAVTFRNDQHGVLVVDNGLVHFRPISLGVQDGKWIAALDGVNEGELVIITATATKPGKEVRAEVMSPGFMED